MNVLDWVLLAMVAGYALSGYWQGFVTGAFATAGLVLGGVFGIWLAPLALGDADPSLWVSMGALFIVILSASLGQALLQYVGGHIRDRISWQPIRAVDAVGGAALAAAAVLLVAWALGVAVTGTRLGSVSAAVRESRVLAAVDQALPASAHEVLRGFDNVVGESFFPRYLEPFAPERIDQVRAGPKRMRTDPDVVRSEASVVKVRSVNACGSGIEGTGFVYADGRVMTNAHVVAGVPEPEVQLGDETYAARAVVYDPDLDLAVLSVPELRAPTLRFAFDAARSDPIAVVGFPNDGPFAIVAGRIRAEQRLRSPNIYGVDTVLRDVWSLRASIRPGNSGGPVLNSAGEVVGVVFAASVSDADTGYALTSQQARETAAIGVASGQAVSTGSCVR